MRALIKQMLHVLLMAYVQIENVHFRIVIKLQIIGLKKQVESLQIVFVRVKGDTKRGQTDIITKFAHG